MLSSLPFCVSGEQLGHLNAAAGERLKVPLSSDPSGRFSAERRWGGGVAGAGAGAGAGSNGRGWQPRLRAQARAAGLAGQGPSGRSGTSSSGVFAGARASASPSVLQRKGCAENGFHGTLAWSPLKRKRFLHRVHLALVLWGPRWSVAGRGSSLALRLSLR